MFLSRFQVPPKHVPCLRARVEHKLPALSAKTPRFPVTKESPFNLRSEFPKDSHVSIVIVRILPLPRGFYLEHFLRAHMLVIRQHAKRHPSLNEITLELRLPRLLRVRHRIRLVNPALDHCLMRRPP